MAEHEREQRIMTAALLLAVLKQNGAAYRFIAQYLKVNPTVLAHWKAIGQDEKRKIGPPTDEQLARLVGLLRFQIEQNMHAMVSFLYEENIRSRERVLALYALEPIMARAHEGVREKKEEWDQLAEEARAAIDKLGPEKARSFLFPAIQSFYGTNPMNPGEDTFYSDTDDALQALKVEAGEVETIKRNMQEYLRERSRKLLRKSARPDRKVKRTKK